MRAALPGSRAYLGAIISWPWLWLWAIALSSAFARGDGAWSRVNEKNGVLIEKRPVAGSPFYEHRATAHSHLAPAQIFAAITSRRLDDPHERKMVKKEIVLAETDHDRVLYQQIHTPIVSDRDCTVRMEWSADPAHNTWDMKFRVDNDAGPPLDKGFVRIPDIHGYWHLEAALDGTRVEYVIYSDPGGSVPAFLVRGPQADSTRDGVVKALAYAEAHAR